MTTAQILATVVVTLIVGYILGAVNTDMMHEEIQEYHGIDPDELIAWIENYQHNYEYVAPPTTGEIIKKIREMDEIINGKDE